MVGDERFQRRARLGLGAGVEARLRVAKIGLRARIGGAAGAPAAGAGGTATGASAPPGSGATGGGSVSPDPNVPGRFGRACVAAHAANSSAIQKRQPHHPSLLRLKPIRVPFLLFLSRGLFCSVFYVFYRPTPSATVLRAKLDTPSAASPPGATQRCESESAAGRPEAATSTRNSSAVTSRWVNTWRTAPR